MNNVKGQHWVVGILAAAFTAAVTQAAAPAGPPAVAATDTSLQEIIVTGTSIPTTPDEVAVPVDILDAAQLKASGVDSNALEILRKTIPAFEGRSNAGTSNANNNNQNTAGGSQVQLRNLPTLVLVNGRRIANSGIGGINGKNFVDVNQIPAAAIDHVEVLTDGASSIYGSDAVGGVVNFVLKSDYHGFTAGARGATGERYGEHSFYLTGGSNIGALNITATASLTHTDPLFQNARAFTSPLYGKTSGIAGVVGGGSAMLNPALTSPSARNPTGVNATAGSLANLITNGTYDPTTPGRISGGFDVSPYQTLLLKQDMASFASTFDMPLIGNDRLSAFGNVMFSRGKSWTKWLPIAATGLSVPAGAPFNPLTTNFTGVTFAQLATPHDFYDRVTSSNVTFGLRGKITSDWNWETGFVYSESDLQQDQTGVIFKPNLAPAIAGGFDASGNALAGGAYSKVYGGYSVGGPLVLQPALDPFATAGGLNPASLANIYGTEVIKAISRLESWDGKIVGRVYHLPAGDIGVAVGASVRRESLSGRADANGRVTDPVTGSTSGNDQYWLGGTYADPFRKDRTISGAFVEARLPVTSASWDVPAFHAFDLTGAVRTEHYSDVGSATVPKFGFRWQPVDSQFTLRGNYAKSFIAPTLFSEYGPTDTRQVGAGVIQGVFGPNYGGLPFNGEDGNNPNLKPANAISRTVGFVLKPRFLKHFTMTADYSDITLTGFQGGLGFNNVLASVNALGSASPYFNNVAIGAFPGTPGATNPFTTPGALLTYLTSTTTGSGDPTKAANLYAIDQFRNLAELIEHSWTVSADYEIPTDTMGTFSLATNGAVFSSFKFQALPGQAFIQYAGAANNTGVFGGTLPKYRFYSTINWNYRDLDLMLGNTYASSVNDTGPNGTSTPQIPVSSYVAWDLRAAYTYGLAQDAKMKIALGVNNLTDRMPPLAPRAFSDNNADVSTYSPIGRLYYGTVEVSF